MCLEHVCASMHDVMHNNYNLKCDSIYFMFVSPSCVDGDSCGDG